MRPMALTQGLVPAVKMQSPENGTYGILDMRLCGMDGLACMVSEV